MGNNPSGFNFRDPVIYDESKQLKNVSSEQKDEGDRLMVIDSVPCEADAMKIVAREVVDPPPGHVRVRVEAASVCFTDTLLRRQMYMEKPKVPFTPGYDFVGIVDAVGEGVNTHSLRIGDRVGDLAVWGGNARYVYWPEDRLLRIPKEVSAVDGTSVMLSFLTAYQQIYRVGKLKPGQKMLMIGGNGAVGNAALQICKAGGITCYATGSTKHHAEFKAMGAIPLGRSPEEWLPAVEGQMDLIIDGVCQDGFASSWAARNSTGILSAMGVSYPISAKFSALYIARKFIAAKVSSRSTFYVITDYRSSSPDEFQEDLTAVCQLIIDKKIAPDVKDVVSFSKVAQLHRDIETGEKAGKYVLDPWL